PDAFRAFQRPGGGYGGLLSLTLHNEAESAPRFFDALRVCKGPNLGMTYTLACPYTILAHYGELEFAESCGMSRHLIRVSVGLEDADDLIERFNVALA
ncbi:MAG: PLP-dependent transferase, partial [Planctomycetaceae bacterium]